MKGKIILLTILVASAIALQSAKFTGTACACSELPTETECKLAGGRCAWVSSACTAVSTDCTTYKAQAGCDLIDGCAWNGTACGTFTNCTSYVVTNGSECYSKAAKCYPGAVNGTNTTCAEQTITNCTTITDSQTCTNLGCTYTTSCAASTCAAQNQTACVSVGSIALNNLVLCAWNNNTCADANATTALTAANCADATDVTYAWINSACTACTGQSSSASLLAVLGFAATILL